MSLARLCRAAGCDYTYLWRILHADPDASRYRRPSYALTRRVGEALDAVQEALAAAGYTPEVPVRQAEVSDRLERLQQDLDSLRARLAPPEWPLAELPVLGRVPAGPGREPLEAPEGRAGVPAAVAGGAEYLLRVAGDSMAPTLLDGDLVAIRPAATAEPGEIVVALVDGEATVKRFETPDGVPHLAADNPDFPARRLAAEAAIAGVVTAAYRPAERLRRRPR